MAEELINSYVDRNGVKGDTSFILESLREVYSEFKKLESVKIDLKGAGGLSNMGPLFSQAKAGADGLATATETVTQRIAQMNGKSKEFTDVLLKQLKAQEAAAKASAAEAKAAAESAKAKGELAKAAQQEAKAAEQLSKAKAAEAKIAEQTAKTNTADLKMREQIRKESDKSAAALRKSNDELKNYGKETEKVTLTEKQRSKLLDEATNDYLQLSKAYNEASLKAKNYVLRLGEGHPIAIQSIKDANDLGNVLKKLDASVGQNQRNVGNYASAYNGLGMSFAQVSRELPSLSISFQQFALAISNNLPMVADELKRAKDEINALKAAGKDAPSILSRVGSAIFSWQVGLSVGITLFTVFSKQIVAFFSSLFTGSSALSDFTRQQKGLNEAIKEGNKAAGSEIAQLEVMYRVATSANIPIKERKRAVDELQKQYPAHFKNINDEIILQGKAAAAYSATKTAILESAQAMAIQSKLGAIATQELDLIKEETDLTNQLAKSNTVLAQQRAKASAEKFDPKGAAASVGQETQNLRIVQQEIKGQQDRVAANKEAQAQLIKDREFYLSQIKALPTPEQGGGGTDDTAKKLKDEADKRIQIAAELRKLELQLDADFYKAQSENEELSLVERLQALQKYYQSRRALIDVTANTERVIGKKTAEELTLIEAQAADERIRLDREIYSQRDKLIKEFSKNFTDQEKKMQDGLAKIAEDGYKRFAKLEEARTKKNDEESKKRRKADEEEAEARKKLQLQLANEIATLAFTVAASGIEREKNQIQGQIDLLEQKKQKDIEVANQTIANAQERAAAISIIEARAAAQKEDLQRKQRDLDVKKAQFDRAQSIARIIQETAQNIVKYFGTPLAFLAGAIGAVQIATVLAQPIPKYKHGKKAGDNYEGPAIVGDGGKKEAIIREDGKVEITSDRPQLTYVKSRDVVLPDANQLVNYVLAGNMGGRLATHAPVSDNGLKNEINEMRKDIVQAIKGKKELHLNAGESGLVAVWKHGANTVTYINENTNW